MPVLVSAALQAAYEDGESLIVRTLEFKVNENGTARYYVHGYSSASLKDDAGVFQTHEPMAMTVSLGARSVELGKSLQFTFPIGDDSNTGILPILDSNIGNTIKVVYREYVGADTTPAFTGVALDVTKVTYAYPNLTVEASFDRVVNTAYPNYYYTAEDFFGLKYYGR